MQAAELAARLGDFRQVGSRYLVRCPAHDDHHPSLEIANGDKGIVLVCRAGCDQRHVFDLVCQQAGIPPQDLFYAPAAEAMASTSQRRIVQTYDYVDSQGTLLFQVVRFEPKDFRQRRPDGKGRWVWKLDGIEPVLYRLPEVLQAVAAETTTHIPEGERDVETLRSLGLIATCNPGGAGKWRAAYAATLRGGHVAILPDNDAPGRQHAEQVARALYGVAASLKIITLPGLPDKGDVSDWVAAGGTADALKALLDATPSWKPTSSTAIHVGEHAFNTSPPWPELSDQALYGLSGEIVRTIAPHTEADPVALLLQFLTMFGNLVGRTPYYITEADWHYLNLFACLVGETSKGRKGVSMGHPRRLLQTVDAA